MRFPWPNRDPDGDQWGFSEWAQAIASDSFWEQRGHELEAWDIEYAVDQMRMFFWNVGVAGGLCASFDEGEFHAEDDLFRRAGTSPSWTPGCGRPFGKLV